MGTMSHMMKTVQKSPKSAQMKSGQKSMKGSPTSTQKRAPSPTIDHMTKNLMLLEQERENFIDDMIGDDIDDDEL